jgi:hypothetical protein
MPRSSAQTLVKTWECNEHIEPGGCWSNEHLTLTDLKTECEKHADICICWRCVVVSYMEPR